MVSQQNILALLHSEGNPLAVAPTAWTNRETTLAEASDALAQEPESRLISALARVIRSHVRGRQLSFLESVRTNEGRRLASFLIEAACENLGLPTTQVELVRAWDDMRTGPVYLLKADTPERQHRWQKKVDARQQFWNVYGPLDWMDDRIF